MTCSSCKQPMVDPDDGVLYSSKRPYSGRLCLDCKSARNHTPTEELDCWEYMTRRQLQWKLRDAAQLRTEIFR